MGRTLRKRRRKYQHLQVLDHEETVINLRKFLTRNGFNDGIKLKLVDFPHTGRGVTTAKNLKENDVLIEVPYQTMISYVTFKSTNFLDMFTCKLTIHDLLAIFLVLEKHKKHSFWTDYIKSLPMEPPWLPSLLSEEHIELLPVDLRLEVKKSRRVLEEGWSRMRKSIKTDWTCSCCGKKADCVITLPSFTWGYILVNTRAVYVDPGIIRELCDWSRDILSDEPSMALCPFLDMFNHSHEARSRAELIYQEGKLVYRLTTLTSYKKYEQVFISYGDHDNLRLLIEYGFFIPGNCYDRISFEAKDVFQLLKLNLSDFKYKFICNHGLDKSLFVSATGPSFNLKGFLFVVSANETEMKKKFSLVVYNDEYPEDFLKITLKNMCQKLLIWKKQNFEKDLSGLDFSKMDVMIVEFLKYRIDFVRTLLLD